MGPRFKLDENLPEDSAGLLRRAGFDVETALSEALGGVADPDLLRASVVEGRVLVTLDLDFSDIHTYPPRSHHGIWVLRPQRQSVRHILDLLQGALRLLDMEIVDQRLWIVEKERVRIRE